MGVTHEIKPDELRNVLKKVQNQYDQTIKMAENKQKNSIQKLCNSWTGDKAVTEIRNLIDKLNSYYTDFSGSVNSSYSKLFDSINSYASQTLSEYGESWNSVNIELRGGKIFEMSSEVARGSGSRGFDFKEDEVIDALAGIQQLAKNVVKNSKETRDIIQFSGAISGTGISDMLKTLGQNLKQVADKIDELINEVVSKMEGTSETFASNLESARKAKDVSSLW